MLKDLVAVSQLDAVLPEEARGVVLQLALADGAKGDEVAGRARQDGLPLLLRCVVCECDGCARHADGAWKMTTRSPHWTELTISRFACIA